MNATHRIRPTILGLLFLFICSTGTALADVPDEFSVTSSPKMALTLTDVNTTEAGTVVSGEITRSRFSSRTPVSGQVAVEVFQADGQSLGQTTGKINPHFVKRGIRASTFAVLLDSPVPTGGHAVVSFAR